MINESIPQEDRIIINMQAWTTGFQNANKTDGIKSKNSSVITGM
jgi:hypothetical protein